MPGQFVTRIWPSDPARDAPPRHRRACRYDVHLPDPLRSIAVRIDGSLAALVSETEQALLRLNGDGGEALRPLARLLLRTESIASSKVEGMQFGVRALARAEVSALQGADVAPTAREVLANIAAMALAVETATDRPLVDVAQILAIHQRLLETSAQARHAGHLRTRQNWIGGNDYTPCGADFVPPPPDHVPSLLADLCDAINDASLPPLVQAALIHAQFETIHPFVDGNGRTGRALIHVVLKRRGLTPHFVPPISIVFADAQGAYVQALTRFREAGDAGIATWIEHFADATRRATRLASAYLQLVRTVQDRWRARLHTMPNPPRSDATVWTLVEWLPASPVMSASMAIEATGRSKSRVYDAIDQLVDVGALQPLSGARRNRAWEAPELLDLIAQLELGELHAVDAPSSADSDPDAHE
ncbi:MAG TPA: Fic family protein [Gemmatimonadaceae bacterium]|nr:Fic family protein [Gemmatimonadaceae bacterium]